MIDEELRTAAEQVSKRGFALVRREPIILLHPDPWKRLPPPSELVALPGQLLLGGEQLDPFFEPLLTSGDRMIGHRSSPFACPRATSQPSPPARRPIRQTRARRPWTGTAGTWLTVPAPWRPLRAILRAVPRNRARVVRQAAPEAPPGANS